MQKEFGLPFEHVSETAWLVAAFRAKESERHDKHFDDYLAKKLVGQKADELLESLPNTHFGVWMMSVRTRVIDEIIQKCVEKGVTTVINLAAGLDTRPYRMNLPQALQWIEVDLPEITQFKIGCLENDTPRCQLQRIVVDLSQKAERRSALDRICGQSDNTLVLTEGLLGYLSPENVNELALDLFAQASVNHWLTDIGTPQFFSWIVEKLHENYFQGGLKFRFTPKEGVHYFQPLGWDVGEFHAFDVESRRLNRFPVSHEGETLSSLEYLSDSGIALLKKQDDRGKTP